MTREEFIRTLTTLFANGVWPKPVHLLKGVELVHRGSTPQEAARAVGTTARAIAEVIKATDDIEAVLGIPLHGVDKDHRTRSTRMLGQLLLGHCAELAFEEIYKREMGSKEFELRDIREGRTDTDYRLYNGQGRPVYRINIKFHGSPFRRARELVGLEPENCFALATYKIQSALQKQHEEGLPYFFAIVGVPNLTGETVGQNISAVLVDLVALLTQAPKGKSVRTFEDTAVRYLSESGSRVFQRTYEHIRNASWYILSARRADTLLRKLLFDRVFALRIRNFARAFRGAELDMHFSLSEDLTPLRTFLKTLREEGSQKITTLLERGEY